MDKKQLMEENQYLKKSVAHSSKGIQKVKIIPKNIVVPSMKSAFKSKEMMEEVKEFQNFEDQSHYLISNGSPQITQQM